MTFVDDYSSGSTFSGNFNGTTQTQMHGYWTTEEAGMVAPSATIVRHDFSTEAPVVLAPNRLNIINASYGLVGTSRCYGLSFNWAAYPQEDSIIQAAFKGTAVVSKAAGNDSVAVGASKNGSLDYFDAGLVNVSLAAVNPTVIFAGALNTNGTTSKKATLASYSNYAGSNTKVQSHFLVVGVDGADTGLYGTSFAAPIISGYAAILGSKFAGATPVEIANQLLNSARTDTIANYSASVYGKGEASLSNALAPVSIH